MSQGNEYVIEKVWGEKTASLENEIVEFWHGNEAVPRELGVERVKQVFCVGRDQAGNIAGVGTVYPKFNKQLENSFYYYRSFVALEHRRALLAANLLKFARDSLEADFVREENTRCIGMLVVVENPQLQKIRNQAVWPHTGFTYIGKNEKGFHVRVYYFEGARIS